MARAFLYKCVNKYRYVNTIPGHLLIFSCAIRTPEILLQRIEDDIKLGEEVSWQVESQMGIIKGRGIRSE